MTITRWDLDDGNMEPCSSGDWTKSQDYDNLEYDLGLITIKYEELVKQVEYLWRCV